MTWEQLENLTPSNGAIKDLKDLIVAEVFTDPKLEDFFTLRLNAHNGEKIGYVGAMSDVGWEGGGCKPDYKKATIDMLEKEWAIGKWQVPLEWCYEDLEDTIAEYTLKTGTDIGDLTSTEYMDSIVYPALKDAMVRMFWRIIWFGDKEAAVTGSGSGVLTTGTDPKLFTVCDGFWKKIFAIGTANEAQKVAITANDETTTALQLSKIKDAGAAIGIFDSLIENADPRLSMVEGAGIFATKTLCDALEKDLKREYKEILTWEQVFGGLSVTTYNGVKIYRIPIWDRLIMKYQNNGTKLNMPHRAVYTSPRELLVGTPANDIMSELRIFFVEKEQMNYTLAKGKIGTEIGQDDLVIAAY